MGFEGEKDVSRRGFLKGAALTGGGGGGAGRRGRRCATEGEWGDGRAWKRCRRCEAGDRTRWCRISPANMAGRCRRFTCPKRAMGSTGLQVSILGMGGYHLGTAKTQEEVNNMVAKALDHGINFFDNAWEYHKGLSEERVGTALKGKRDQAIVMTKVCTHGRKKDVAMKQLENSLTRLQTDHLDVWQVHEVVYYNDPEMIYEP